MKTITIPFDHYLDLITRSGCAEYGTIDPQFGMLVRLADPDESLTHVEDCGNVAKVYRIRDWLESAAKRNKIVATMDAIKAESERRNTLLSNARSKLIAKLGESQGSNVYLQVINGALPAVAEKLGLTWLIKGKE